MFNGDTSQLMQQAKKIQDNIKKIQDEIGSIEIEGESGAGLVKVCITGSYDAKSVSIQPDVLKEEKVVIEELITAAFNDAVKKVENKKKEKLAEMGSEFGLPPGMQMPF